MFYELQLLPTMETSHGIASSTNKDQSSMCTQEKVGSLFGLHFFNACIRLFI